MVESKVDNKKVREQIEYYMSDANLSRDKFFREQIMTDKEGWVACQHFLNCNKVKAMGINTEKIANAIDEGSKTLEMSKDKKKVRRIGNPALPEQQRKRDAKATEKGQAPAKNAEPKEDEIGEDGKIILVEKDFDNP